MNPSNLTLKTRFIRYGDVVPPDLSCRLKDLRDTDNVIVSVDDDGIVYAILISRPVQFVESMYISDEIKQPRAKERTLRDMIQFGLGWATANGCPEAVFLNEKNNTAVRDFLAQFGAGEQIQDCVVSYLPLVVSCRR